jgi:hypothetical protein
LISIYVNLTNFCIAAQFIQSTNQGAIIVKNDNNKLKKINYVGYLVPGNQGDEGLYKISQTLFGRYTFDLVRTRNTNDAQYSQVTLIGGGSIIPTGFAWAKLTKYAYVFGAGVLDPVFYGYSPLLIERLKRINFRLFGVRGNLSKAFLENWGIASEVIGDPCLSLKPKKVEQKENLIGINIGAGFKGGFFGSQGQVIREMAQVCKVLKKRGYDLVLIPFWKDNLKEINALSELEDIKIFDRWTDIEATLQLISKCKIFIGEKLHSIIFSAAAQTPFVSLAYAPEHFDFLDSVGFTDFSVRISDVTSKKIMELFDSLNNNYDLMLNKLILQVEKYREKQTQFAARIASDIESLPDDKFNTQTNIANKVLWKTDLLLYIKANRIWRLWNKLFFLRLMSHIA